MFDMKSDISLETRQRLLDAAGEVFAERGFAQATVREICGKAGANIAAVNYHFGNKQKLYEAVFQHLQKQMGEDVRHAATSDGSPEDRLREYIRRFLRGLLGQGESCHGRLMAREMNEPTGALDQLVEGEIRPRMVALQSIVRDLAGDLPPRAHAKIASSIVAQMLHYHFARPVLKRLSPIYPDLEEHIEELVDHITRFSLGGIRGVAERYQADRK
jgi:AcrR family transcriptional regulator